VFRCLHLTSDSCTVRFKVSLVCVLPCRYFVPRGRVPISPDQTILFMSWAGHIMLLGSKCGGVDFSLCAKWKLCWVDELCSLAADSITSILKLRCFIFLTRLSDINANEFSATKRCGWWLGRQLNSSFSYMGW